MWKIYSSPCLPLNLTSLQLPTYYAPGMLVLFLYSNQSCGIHSCHQIFILAVPSNNWNMIFLLIQSQFKCQLFREAYPYHSIKRSNLPITLSCCPGLIFFFIANIWKSYLFTLFIISSTRRQAPWEQGCCVSCSLLGPQCLDKWHRELIQFEVFVTLPPRVPLPLTKL